MSPAPELSEAYAPVYTAAGLAALWGVSDQFIYDEIRRGRLKAMRFGGKLLRVRRDAIEEYEQQASLAAIEAAPEPIMTGPCPCPPPSLSLVGVAAEHSIRLERRTRPGQQA